MNDKPTTTRARPGHVSLPWNEFIGQGTIFRPRYEEGKRHYSAALSIYNGRRPDGSYYDTIWMQIHIWGDRAGQAARDLVEQARVQVYGHLSQYTPEGEEKRRITMITVDWYELRTPATLYPLPPEEAPTGE